MEEIELTSRDLDLDLRKIRSDKDYSSLTAIPVITDPDFSYQDFFESFLIPNIPCIFKSGLTRDWPLKDLTFFSDLESSSSSCKVPVSKCGEKFHNAHKSVEMELSEYLTYYRGRGQGQGQEVLYLKDWHFAAEFPALKAYETPRYFCSDWLNEMDRFRFIYIGPRGSWTPFHADVYGSYSWSANVKGRKKWVLFPPGQENRFRKLPFDLDEEVNQGKFAFDTFRLISSNQVNKHNSD